MSTEYESLRFKIGLSGTGSQNPCQYQILINDQIYIESYSKHDITYYEFECKINEGINRLQIKLLDKNDAQHVVKDQSGNIIEDFLLNIESVEVDDINLGSLLWSHSEYYPIYPENYLDLEQKSKKILKEYVTLGWNGTWVLEFSSPFYMWLLENI